MASVGGLVTFEVLNDLFGEVGLLTTCVKQASDSLKPVTSSEKGQGEHRKQEAPTLDGAQQVYTEVCFDRRRRFRAHSGSMRVGPTEIASKFEAVVFTWARHSLMVRAGATSTQAELDAPVMPCF